MQPFPIILFVFMAMGWQQRHVVKSFSARPITTSRPAAWNTGARYPRHAPRTSNCLSSIQQQQQQQQHSFSLASRCRIFSSYGNSSRHCSTTGPSTTTRLFSTSDVSPVTTTTSSSSSSSSSSLILEGLNPSQVAAVTQSPKAVTRVIAGPGSGKTKVLTCRVAYLLDQEPRSRVLAVTFTKKAAEEMRQRVELLLIQQQEQQQQQQQQQHHHQQGVTSITENDGVVNEDLAPHVPKDLGRVTMGTFHSICSKILRYNGDLLESLESVQKDMVGRSQDGAVNLDGNFAILDQSDQLRLLKECMDEMEIDLKKSAVKPLQVLTAIGTIKEAHAQGKDPFAENQSKKPIPKPLKYARDVYGLYREKVLSNNALDFDDLIFMTREMLIMYPVLRERLHQRWPHLLVDEFQDTSIIQMDLVKLLTSRSLFVVGDADQSIYSWRGAHAGSLSDFATEFHSFAEDGVQTVFLKENYRSTSNIVSAAEKIISSSGKSSNGKEDEPRRAMKPKRGSGPPPRVVACADERAEANFVVDTIKDMIADSSLGSKSTVAIIYRTNAQSRYLEEACVQKNIPYVIRGGAGGFYKRAEVKDCLCFLRWLYNGNDESAMLRAFKTPSRGLGDKAIQAFRDYYTAVDDFYRESLPGTSRPTRLDILTSLAQAADKGISLVEGAPEPSEFIPTRAVKNFLPFAAQMRMIRDKAYTTPVDSLLFLVIEEFQLMPHFDAISKSKTEFQERRENVQELRQATKRYSGGAGPALLKVTSGGLDSDFLDDNESPLGNFLDDVALVSDIKSSDEESGDSRLVVNLMTIHASKGTEFDAVFVVGNEEGTLPSSMSMQEGEDSIAMEEERRLCYVAITRAKTRLILTWRKEVTMFSSWSEDGPKVTTKERSRFLDPLVKKPKGGEATSTKSTPSRSSNTDQELQQRRSYSSSGPSQPRRNNLHDQKLRNRADLQQSNSVRARQKPISLESNLRDGISRRNAPPSSQQERAPSSREATSQVSAKARTGTSATPQRYSSTPPTRAPADHQRTPQQSTPRSKPAPEANKPFDSTLFYPIGSDVVHNNFGKGVVLQPPPSTDSTKLLVRVKFDNGRTMEFPADGHDLVPVF